MLKKAKVVMLPTNEKVEIGEITCNITTERLFIMNEYTYEAWEISNGGGNQLQSKNLYIISDEEIKEGDWCYEKETNSIFQAKEFTKSGLVRSNSESYILDACKKIICTTDKHLEKDGEYCKICLPEPSQSFIQKYIEEYNKGNVIENILVEYEDKITVDMIIKTGNKSGLIRDFGIKVNPKDNTITIKPVKDSWNREEVIDLCRSAYDTYGEIPFKDWIEENL